MKHTISYLGVFVCVCARARVYVCLWKRWAASKTAHYSQRTVRETVRTCVKVVADAAGLQARPVTCQVLDSHEPHERQQPESSAAEPPQGAPSPGAQRRLHAVAFAPSGEC